MWCFWHGDIGTAGWILVTVLQDVSASCCKKAAWRNGPLHSTVDDTIICAGPSKRVSIVQNG